MKDYNNMTQDEVKEEIEQMENFILEWPELCFKPLNIKKKLNE